MAVGQHQVLSSALGLQPDRNIGDPVVEAGEAPEEVDGEGPGGALDVHGQLVGARCRLLLNVLDLLQQVAHRQDLVLLAAHGPGSHTGDPLQMSSGLGDKTIQLFWLTSSIKVDLLCFRHLLDRIWMIST